MNNPKDRVPWSRFLLEGVVIVFSILLAFAIDAWWDERQEEKAQLERLARVAAELESNSERLGSKTEILQGAVDATSGFLSWMNPVPQDVPTQEFIERWNEIVSIGTFSIVRSATDDFLAAGSDLTLGDVDMRSKLSEWYLASDALEYQYELLRLAHGKLIDYTNNLAAAPSLRMISEVSIMQKHPQSSFPFDQVAYLSDPVVESLLAVYLIRMEFVIAIARQHQERQARLLELIRSYADG